MSRIARVSSNAVALLLSDGTTKAATFALYALVARHLGTLAFAQLSLALTLLYTFQVFALAGVRTLTAREVAKDKTKTEKYLVNGSIITIVASLVAIVMMWLFTRLMGYSSETSIIIFLLSLSLFSYSLSVLCEAVFQAWEKMHYTAYTNIPINLMTTIAAFILLSQGHGLYSLAVLYLVTSMVALCIRLWLLLRNIIRPHLSVDISAVVHMAKSASIFLGIDGCIAIWGSLNFVLLSKMGENADVGLFNAATQVIAPVTLIYQGIIASIFPIMCRKFEPNSHTLRPMAEYLTELLLIIAIPTAFGLFFLADSVAMLLYGNKDFLMAIGTLQVIVWTLVTTALTHVFGQILIASLRESLTLRIVVTNALINFVLGFILIYQFGLIGAAMTSVLVGIINLIQHYLPLAKLLPSKVLLGLAWKPLVASCCMVLYFMMEKSDNGLFSIIPAATIYCSALFALAIWSSGGLDQFKMKYFYAWS